MSDPAHNDVENGETANGRVRSIAWLGGGHLEDCDLCGDTKPMSEMTWTGKQMLCKKCL